MLKWIGIHAVSPLFLLHFFPLLLNRLPSSLLDSHCQIALRFLQIFPLLPPSSSCLCSLILPWPLVNSDWCTRHYLFDVPLHLLPALWTLLQEVVNPS